MAARPAPAVRPILGLWNRLFKRSQPIVVLLALSGLSFFGMVTDEMREGGSHRFDAAILIGLRQAGNLAVPLGPAWLPQTAVDVSALGGSTVLWMLSLAAVGYLLLTGRRLDAVLVAGSIGGGSLVNTGLKLIFARPRPEVVPHLVAVSNASYPSGHAMLAATAYLTIAAVLARSESRAPARAYLVGAAVLLVVLIGLSRLYLGVHWPSDVLGGWCLGSAWALGAIALSRRLQGPAESKTGSPTTPPTTDAGLRASRRCPTSTSKW